MSQKQFRLKWVEPVGREIKFRERARSYNCQNQEVLLAQRSPIDHPSQNLIFPAVRIEANNPSRGINPDTIIRLTLVDEKSTEEKLIDHWHCLVDCPQSIRETRDELIRVVDNQGMCIFERIGIVKTPDSEKVDTVGERMIKRSRNNGESLTPWEEMKKKEDAEEEVRQSNRSRLKLCVEAFLKTSSGEVKITSPLLSQTLSDQNDSTTGDIPIAKISRASDNFSGGSEMMVFIGTDVKKFTPRLRYGFRAYFFQPSPQCENTHVWSSAVPIPMSQLHKVGKSIGGLFFHIPEYNPPQIHRPRAETDNVFFQIQQYEALQGGGHQERNQCKIHSSSSPIYFTYVPTLRAGMKRPAPESAVLKSILDQDSMNKINEISVGSSQAAGGRVCSTWNEEVVPSPKSRPGQIQPTDSMQSTWRQAPSVSPFSDRLCSSPAAMSGTATFKSQPIAASARSFLSPNAQEQHNLQPSPSSSYHGRSPTSSSTFQNSPTGRSATDSYMSQPSSYRTSDQHFSGLQSPQQNQHLPAMSQQSNISLVTATGSSGSLPASSPDQYTPIPETVRYLNEGETSCVQSPNQRNSQQNSLPGFSSLQQDYNDPAELQPSILGSPHIDRVTSIILNNDFGGDNSMLTGSLAGSTNAEQLPPIQSPAPNLEQFELSDIFNNDETIRNFQRVGYQPEIPLSQLPDLGTNGGMTYLDNLYDQVIQDGPLGQDQAHQRGAKQPAAVSKDEDGIRVDKIARGRSEPKPDPQPPRSTVLDKAMKEMTLK